MAVKDGLPATDFSKMNRDYIRNVAEGETVKDGLPATDFSRMNREYIKAVVEEAGGGITVEELNVTENDTYTAPEGKAYSPVTVNVPDTGIPAPAITATFVISDYSDVTLLETYIVEETEGNYQQITLTEVTQETTVITGLVFPSGYANGSIHWGISPYCSDGENDYNVSTSNTVNCVADEFGTVEVTDVTQPCSVTFTFTKV